MRSIRKINHSKNNSDKCMYIELKYTESLTFSLLGINEFYIVLHSVFHFHGTYCRVSFTPMLLFGGKPEDPFHKTYW